MTSESNTFINPDSTITSMESSSTVVINEITPSSELTEINTESTKTTALLTLGEHLQTDIKLNGTTGSTSISTKTISTTTSPTTTLMVFSILI